MKATINGISVEGSPQEIANYLKLIDDMRRDGIHIKPPLGNAPDWVHKQMMITSGSTGKCPNVGSACYCTGACR